MPNVLFEATALGMPILASNIEEISHHFTDNYDAFLFEVNSVKSISNAIERVLKDPSSLDIIYNNAYNTIQKYSINSMVNQYELIYKNNK